MPDVNRLQERVGQGVWGSALYSEWGEGGEGLRLGGRSSFVNRESSRWPSLADKEVVVVLAVESDFKAI